MKTRSVRVKEFIKRSFSNFYVFMLLILTGFLIMPITASGGALPSGQDVQIGNPSITVDNKEMTIDAGQSNKTWIDWHGGFNIGVENTVNNIGPSPAAAMLHNDISGSISNIQGMLKGNLNVFLLNASGILFSPTAQVNVGGLVASTLRMTQEDFLAGNYILRADNLRASSAIINAGAINAFGEGGVTLLGGAVRNTGSIKADLGTVNLLAGKEVTLNIAGNGSIHAAVTKEILSNVYDQDGNKVNIGVENLGTITADGGEIRIEAGAVKDVFDTLINQDGVVRAGSLVERNGKIVLVSHSEGIVQNTGTLDASGIEEGAKGGEIEMRGSKVGQFGKVHADAMGDGDGGNIVIYAHDVVALSSGSLTTANATTNGDGGEIIVYSPETALFWEGARIEAKGGALSGDGGFVEVSGKKHVEVYGIIDTGAPQGKAGTFLVDPNNIIISTATDANITSATPFESTNDSAVLNITTLVTALGTSDVIVRTMTAGFNAEDGDITVANAIDFNEIGAARTLTLEAHNDIIVNVNATISDSTPGGESLNLVFTADRDSSGVGNVNINAAITTEGGSFTSSSTDFDNTGGAITTNNGAVNLTHTGTVLIGGAINSGTATTTISAGGNITSAVAGAITANSLVMETTGSGSTIGTVLGTNPLSSSPLLINAVTLKATTNLGHIVIKDSADGVAIDAMTTGGIKDAGDATRIILEAVGGAITATGAGTHIDAWAANLTTSENTSTLTHGGAIGAAATPIKTDVTVLNATADDGGIYINQPDDAGSDVDIILGNITAKDGGRTPFKNEYGVVVINTDGDVGTYDVVITAGGDIFNSGYVIAPDEVTITAEDTISDTHDGNDFIATTLTLNAGGDANIGIGQSANPLETMVGTINATSGASGIYLTESNIATIGTVTSTGANNDVSIIANLGDIRLGAITAIGATVTVDSKRGNITDNNAGAVNIIADGAVFSAKTGIGASTDAIETTVGTISATTTDASAEIWITETDALTSITAVTNNSDVSIVFSPGTFAFTASTGLLTLPAGANLDISFSNTGGKIVQNGISVGTGDLTLTASTDITQSGTSAILADAATLTAGTFIGVSGTPILTNVATLTAAASDGGVYVSETDAVTLTASAAGTSKDIVVSNVSGDMTINAVTATRAVNLTAAGSLLDGNAAAKNISGEHLTLVATSGAIGTSGDPVESEIAGTIAATSTTGVFLSNIGDVTQLDASATGVGDISFTNTGSVVLGVISAAGDTVTFNVSSDITDLADVTTDIIAATLNVTADSFGATGNKIETDVSTMNSIVTSSGGIFIADLAGDLTIGTITAGGAGSDVEFSSVGNIVLGAITAAGDDVVLITTAGAITDGNADAVNITAKTLEISATGTIGTALDPLEFAVSQISTDSVGDFKAVNTGAISVTAASLQGKTTAVSLIADDITILDNGGGTITMGAGGSLYLKANYGNIVFLNASDTIDSNAGTIELYANYAGDPTGLPTENLLPGRIVVGNLTSDNKDITLEAYSDITIGLLNAGDGNVTVKSSHGLILDGNAAANNIVANIATLSAQMHTAAAAELARENTIAEYFAKVTETKAKKSSVDIWKNYTTLAALAVDNAEAVKNTAQSIYNSTKSNFDSESNILNTMNTVLTVLQSTRIAAQIVKDAASFPAAAAQAVPVTGDFGAATVSAAIDLIFSLADAAVLAYEKTTLNPQQDKVNELQYDLDVAEANLYSATNDFNNATDAANAASGSLNIATADYNAAVIARDHAEVIRAQTIESFGATNAIGTSSQLGIQASTVNVTTTGTAGTAALKLTGATDVTLDTTGDINIANAAAADATLNLVTDNGDIIYTQTGAGHDTLITVITADTIDGTVNITSAGAIYDATPGGDDVIDITAATINLNAGAGGIGQTNGSLDINATVALNADTTVDGGSITIDDHTGDLPVGAITAGSGTLTLDSVNGAINDATTDTTTDITADTIVLNAATGIGSGKELELSSALSVTAAATTGNIDIDHVADAPVTTLSLTTTSGNINYGQTGSQPLEVTLATVTDGDIAISNNGAVNVVDINGDAADGVVTLTATGSALTSTDSADAVLAHTLTIVAAGTVGADSGNNVVGTDWFDIDVTNLNITTAGATYIDENDDINLAEVTTTGELGIDAAGVLTVTKVSSTGNAVFLTTDAAIVDGGETGTDVTSSSLRMTAGTGIGNDAAGLETAVSTLAATTTTGDINVANTGALAIGTLDAVAGLTITAGGVNDNIVITAASPLTVNTAVSNTGGGDITLAALGATAADDLTLNANVTASGGAGNIYLYAGDSVIQNAGTTVDAASTGAVKVYAGEDWTDTTVDADGTSTGVITMNDNALIDAETGIIIVKAPGDITLGGLLTMNATATAVTITSTNGGIIDGGDIYTDIVANTGAAVVTIDAVTGVGDGNALETEVAAINIDNTPGTGSTNVTANIQIIELAAGGDLIVQKAVQGDRGVDAKNSGNIDISAQDGTLTISGTVLARDGGTITLDAEDSGGGDRDVIINNTITSRVGLKDVGVGTVFAGAITITSDHDIDVNAKVSVANANAGFTANGDITLTTDAGQGGDVKLGAEIETVGTGDIIILAAQNVDFDAAGGLLDTSETSSTGADVTITATTGNIVESYNDTAAPDLDIQARTITLNAVNGAIGQGAGGAIDIDSVVSVSGDTSTGGGNITLNEMTGNLLVALIDAGAGAVTLTAASAIEEDATADAAADIIGATLNLIATSGGIGALAAIEIDSTATVNADSSAAGGNINLTETAGNLNVGLVTAGTGDVTLTAAAGAIEGDATADAAADIIGATLNLTAGNGGIGAAAALKVDATTLLNADSSANNGDIVLLDTAGDMPVGLITAGTANVTLGATAGTITDGSLDAAADVVASGLYLYALGGVGASGNNAELDTTVDTIDDMSATDNVTGNIYIIETNDVTLGSVYGLTTDTGVIDIDAAGTITLNVVTAADAVHLYATAGNIVDNTTGTTLTTSGATSSLRASGIIGTAVSPYNPVDVSINGDLWVWAGSQQNAVSAILEGTVLSSAKTERVEIFKPSPPGLVMLNNRLMGGGNYGSGSKFGSILSRGYGETVIVRADMVNLFYERAMQPWGYQIPAPWALSEVSVVDNEFLDGPVVIIDGSQVGVHVLPRELLMAPGGFQPNYYIIRRGR